MESGAADAALARFDVGLFSSPPTSRPARVVVLQGCATSRAVSAVVLERLVGLSVLLLNGLVGALLLAESNSLARVYLIWCLGGLVVATLAVALVVAGRSEVASAIASSRFLQPVIANLRRIARRHPACVSLIVYSVAFQIVAATVTLAAFRAVGADLTISRALLITAAAGLAAVLPISISGIGVVEGSIVGAGVALRIDYDLRREGWDVGKKRLYRIYREEGLALRRKRPWRRVSAAHLEQRRTAGRPNELWSMDFVSDQLADGRRFRALTVVDCSLASV